MKLRGLTCPLSIAFSSSWRCFPGRSWLVEVDLEASQEDLLAVGALHLGPRRLLGGQQVLALGLGALALGQVIAHLVLTLPRAQRRADRRLQGDDAYRLLQQRHVSDWLRGEV